jgi:tetratricopeptide (TPR) repeat protein
MFGSISIKEEGMKNNTAADSSESANLIKKDASENNAAADLSESANLIKKHANENNGAADLSESINLIRKEVDALQITVMSQKTPWYRNLSTTIALMALLFSFGTTYVSYTRTEAQDRQSMRAELRGLLQRLSNISRDSVELPKKYSGDPVTLGAISGLLNQENALLTRQAAELARKLPKDSVSATESLAIAAALQNSYNLEGAKEFFGYAIESANDFNDKITALRSNANLLFIMGQPELGRVEYAKALNIFSTFAGYSDFTQKTTNIQTELSWAYAEAGAGFKDQANQHISAAESYVSKLPPGPGTDNFEGLVNAAKRALNTPGTPKTPPALP